MNHLSNKTGTSITSIGALFSASAAHAIVNMGAPFSLEQTGVGFQTNLDWDIDGDGNREVRFNVDIRTFDPLPTSHRLNTSPNDLETGFWAKDGPGLRLFNEGEFVNSSALFGGRNPRQLTNALYYSIFSSSTNKIENILSDDVISQLSGNPSYIGFRFKEDSESTEFHYGYGLLNVSFDLPNSISLSITDVYWETEAGVGIQVGAIPEPQHVTTGLGLLALGATGLARWRRSREKS